ncbi:MAG: CvpA family protein [Oscillospiraceae bacterium]|nr:CvpA family protein [Oscillospiraceae bacterium]
MNVLDIVILIALAIFTVFGANRGLIMTLCGLVIAVLALVGSPVVADTVSPVAAAIIQPGLENTIQDAVDEAVANGQEITIELPEAIEESGLMEMMLNSEVYQHFASAVESGVESGMEGVAEGVSTALANTMAWFFVYIVAFLAILVLGNLVARLLNLASMLPGLNFLNKSLGAVLGFLKGAVYMSVFASLASSFGLVPPEMLDGSLLLKLFASFAAIALAAL